MKRNKLFVTVVATLFLVSLLTAGLSVGVSASSIEDQRERDKRLGYVCTDIYHGYADEGYAGVRVYLTPKFMYNMGGAVAMTESTSTESIARIPYGYARFYYGIIGTSGTVFKTNYHTTEPEWADHFGTIAFGCKKVSARVKLCDEDGATLTGYCAPAEK